jgi:hypothetical protein
MTPVRWHQYYNDYCPIVNGVHAPAGCVTTAVAQLLSIYKSPTSYSGYTFNWDAMIAGNDDNGICRLMEQLGKPGNLNVNYYGIDGSSASFDDVPHTLVSFGFAIGGAKDDYDNDAVMLEVMSNRPVLIGGRSTIHRYVYNALNIPIYYDNINGHYHAWLGDGGKTIARTFAYYNALDGSLIDYGTFIEQYVHCNWGNSSDSNAINFYLSGAFDLSDKIEVDNYSGGYHHYYFDDRYFLFDQEMVVNIYK